MLAACQQLERLYAEKLANGPSATYAKRSIDSALQRRKGDRVAGQVSTAKALTHAQQFTAYFSTGSKRLGQAEGAEPYPFVKEFTDNTEPYYWEFMREGKGVQGQLAKLITVEVRQRLIRNELDRLGPEHVHRRATLEMVYRVSSVPSFTTHLQELTRVAAEANKARGQPLLRHAKKVGPPSFVVARDMTSIPVSNKDPASLPHFLEAFGFATTLYGALPLWLVGSTRMVLGQPGQRAVEAEKLCFKENPCLGTRVHLRAGHRLRLNHKEADGTRALVKKRDAKSSARDQVWGQGVAQDARQ